MKKIVIAVTFLVGLVACGDAGKSKFASADAYDDYITSRVGQMQQTLFAVQKVTADDTTGTADLTGFVNQIDSVAKNIKDLPEYNGNTAYRDAAAKLAEFYKSSVSGSYAEISKVYKEVKDTAQIDSKIAEIITKLQQDETKADDDFMKEREAFATKNNIKLDEAAPQ